MKWQRPPINPQRRGRVKRVVERLFWLSDVVSTRHLADAAYPRKLRRTQRARLRSARPTETRKNLSLGADKPAAIAATMPHRRALRRRLISWLRVSLAVWRGGLCAALAGVHREPLCSPEPL
jgi:hypothetical protein